MTQSSPVPVAATQPVAAVILIKADATHSLLGARNTTKPAIRLVRKDMINLERICRY